MARRVTQIVSEVFPYGLLQAMSKPAVFAPFYHTVSPKPLAHISALYPVLTPQQFEQQLLFFLDHFQPVAAQQVPLVLSGDLKLEKPALFLSFDDGFREILTHVKPILSKHDVPATIFVNPNFVGNNHMFFRCKVSVLVNRLSDSYHLKEVVNTIEKYKGLTISTEHLPQFLLNLNAEDIQLIDTIAQVMEVDFGQYLAQEKPYLTVDELVYLSEDGFTIGAHSMWHPLFSEISYSEQVAQIEQSVNWVQKHIPSQPKLFAFPFTSHGADGGLYSHFIDSVNPKLDLMLGTSGHKPTNNPRFLHRTPMETGSLSAKRRLKDELFRYLIKNIAGKGRQNV